HTHHRGQTQGPWGRAPAPLPHSYRRRRRRHVTHWGAVAPYQRPAAAGYGEIDPWHKCALTRPGSPLRSDSADWGSLVQPRKSLDILSVFRYGDGSQGE